ncbi:uncharacterized protein LOC122638956 [Telopea speciosissima]|uniref:uncharacterized protein LOC122638956 n=1 Tax=Telopea speciosissima TaxID=54955 RepID=UPI001CC36CE1|nr:uncharacterized protein LOC122638956 [Telopea speciosissima]
MEKSLLNLKKPIKANPIEKPHSKSNRFSISAFLFFIFFCFSMLHFHPSPSKLFHNTKFWFFLSNALILIIATDSGAFSSSKHKDDTYEEYLMNNRARINVSSNSKPTTATSFIKELPPPPPPQPEKSLVIDTESKKLPESMPEDVSYKSGNFESLEDNKAETRREQETHVEDDGCETKEIRRSKSEEWISVTGNENKKSLSRSVTEGHEQSSEEKELWAMSDEELNRRVEEFIRFNRQMRLQETRRLVLVGDN